MPAVQETIEQVSALDVDKYKFGFTTEIESELAPKGLNEDIVRFISAKKNEPEWLTEMAAGSLPRWQTMVEPDWARVDYPAIDFQDCTTTPRRSAPPARRASTRSIRSCSRPTRSLASRSAIRRSWRGVEGATQPRVAVDAVFDSVSVVTTSRRNSPRRASSSAPCRRRCASIPSWCGSISAPVPTTDNYYATLNSAVFSDGSFVYIPRACAARWSCRPTSASTRKRPASSSAP